MKKARAMAKIVERGTTDHNGLKGYWELDSDGTLVVSDLALGCRETGVVKSGPQLLADVMWRQFLDRRGLLATPSS